MKLSALARLRSSRKGFTIVETMVVLAVTGLLFVMIAATLSGRQRQSEFTRSIHDVRAQLQQTISEVQTGYYANLGGFKCSVVGGSNVKIQSGSNESGTNGDCIFLGDAIQFAIAGTDPEEYRVFPIAANRLANDLSEADAALIFKPGGLDNSTAYQMRYGLQVVRMAAAGNNNIGGLAILSSLSELGPNASGTSQVDIYALPNTRLHKSKGYGIEGDLHGAAVKNPTGGVKICIASGGTDQYGLITIGQKNQQLSVGLDIMNKDGNANCNL